MGQENLTGSVKPTFNKVSNVPSLIPILEARLPRSCNIYNMVLIHSKFPTEMSFYTFCTTRASESDCSSQSMDCWIVATYKREDYGVDVNISYPSSQSGIENFSEALINSGIVDWDKHFIFAAVDEQIHSLVDKLILDMCGKPSIDCPNVVFYMNSEEALALDLSRDSLKVSLKPMEIHEGARFLRDNWKFAKSGSLAYCQKLVERNGSAGVYVDKELVSGVTLNGSGLISMLHTLTERRFQGWGQLCMKYFIQALAKQNLIPCCTVEVSNGPSMALQKKIGLKQSHTAYYFSKPY